MLGATDANTMPVQEDVREIQQNEADALQAIYMDDFEDCTEPTAWNAEPSPSFRVTLKSSGESETPVRLRIKVTMTATYPKSLPIIKVEESANLHPKQVEVLKKLIDTTARKLIGQEMIFEITSTLQDKLDEYERMGSEATSLEEARRGRIQAERERKIKEEEERRRQEEAEELEEERMLDRMVQDELTRRTQQREREQSPLPQGDDLPKLMKSSGVDDIVTFDRIITMRGTNGGPIRFQQVVGRIPTGPVFFGDSYIVKPYLGQSEENNADLQLLLTEIMLTEPFWSTSEGRRQLQELESELEQTRLVRHDYVVPLYEFRFEKQVHGWKVTILTQYSPLGTLSNMLDTVDTVNLKVARTWSIQILEGLEALHKAGVTHKMLTVDNILLFRNRDLGETTVKLANVSYGHKLFAMNKAHPFSRRAVAVGDFVTDGEKWLPPESGVGGAKPTRKTDVWSFGVTFAKMIAGKSICQEYLNPHDFINSWDLSYSLREFLIAMFASAPKKRPSALDLLPSQFLRSSEPMSMSLSSQSPATNGTNHGNGSGHSVESSRTSLEVSTRPRAPSNRGNHHRPSFNSHAARPSGVYSRYASDFDEGALLGRGGYGEVVRARNKLDGRFYAIKKIQATADELTHILQEVILLSRLNHQYVVRYYAAWLEDDYSIEYDENVFESDSDSEGIESQTDSSAVRSKVTSLSSSLADLRVNERDLSRISSSLDFISNSRSGYPTIQFGESSDEDETSDKPDTDSESSSDDEELSSSDSARNGQVESHRREQKPRSTLFIQMEYCERHTLADLIKGGIHTKPDEYWRLFRQVVEALAHIHREGIIHRDLKPSNIFIDQNGNVKVGDFGLAKSIGQNPAAAIAANQSIDTIDDLTADVGTTLYVAVEVMKKASGGNQYNEKVDMYSLGIIFFEMVYPMSTGMERASILMGLRSEKIAVPQGFITGRYDTERKLVRSLLDHVPGNRPSAEALLQSGLIPLANKDETIKEALRALVDPSPDSPWLYEVCNALFSRSLHAVQRVLYDRLTGRPQTSANRKETSMHLTRAAVSETLRDIFELHGAVENDNRSHVFPRAIQYADHKIVELMDPTGNILQLPYDLTMPFARRIAETVPEFRKSFCFGSVYRADDNNKGLHPIAFTEVDFNIVTSTSQDHQYHEAEVVKVLDEIADAFPCFKAGTVSLCINHSDILQGILDFCGFTGAQKHSALKLLGEKGLAPSRPGVRNELLANSTLSATSINDLEAFGFRDEFERAEQRLLKMIDESGLTKPLREGLANVRSVVGTLRKLGVTKRIYFAPLSNYHEQFYRSGIMFQAVVEDGKKYAVIGAGGRYDRLVRQFRTTSLDGGAPTAHAVGFNLSFELLADAMHAYREAAVKKAARKGSRQTLASSVTSLAGPWIKPRCDVLVTSFNPATIKGLCVDILRDLWAAGISADLVSQVLSSEALVDLASRDSINWVVVAKQSNAYTASVNYKPVRVKNIAAKTDVDLAIDELVGHLQLEIAERNKAVAQQTGTRGKKTVVAAPGPSADTTGSVQPADETATSASSANRITILNESGRLKGGKKNRWLVEEKCRDGLSAYLSSLASLPVYTVDVREETIQAMLTVSPRDLDEWKRKVVGAAPNQKAYLCNIQAALAKEQARGTDQVLLYSTKSESVHLYKFRD